MEGETLLLFPFSLKHENMCVFISPKLVLGEVTPLGNSNSDPLIDSLYKPFQLLTEFLFIGNFAGNTNKHNVVLTTVCRATIADVN